MDIVDFMKDVAAHQYAAALLIFAVYCRALLSPSSRFVLNLPVNWRPLPVAFAGALIADLSAMQAGLSALSALGVGFVGLVTAGFFDGLLVAIFGSAEAAPSWARAIVGLIDASAPPASKPRGMIELRLARGLVLAGLVLALFAVGPRVSRAVAPARVAVVQAEGCSWLQSNQPVIQSQLEADGSCVLGQVLAGTTDPLKIGLACGIQVVGQVIADVASLWASYSAQIADAGAIEAGAPPDDAGEGGAPAQVLVLASSCAGALPFKGAPACLSQAALAQLARAHASCQAAAKAGVK